MADNPVIVDDLVKRWRPVSEDEVGTAQAFLDDAWEELIARVPGIEARLDSGSLRPGLVIARVIPVIRGLMQQDVDGYIDESLDDWRGRKAEAGAGRQMFSDDDIDALLSPIRKSARCVRMGW